MYENLRIYFAQNRSSGTPSSSWIPEIGIQEDGVLIEARFFRCLNQKEVFISNRRFRLSSEVPEDVAEREFQATVLRAEEF
jgi:hypothetical protein